MATSGWEDVVQPDTFEYLMTPYKPVNNTKGYPGLREGYSGPTAEALRAGDSPAALISYCMSVVLWQHITVCSNEYSREMISRRVDKAYERHRKKRRWKPQLSKKTRRDIRQ